MEIAATHVQEQVALESTCELIRDDRAFVDSNLIVYKSLHRFRALQCLQGVNTRQLTDVQWGLVHLNRCHHVSCVSNPQSSSTKAVTEVSCLSYRVRICKTCRGVSSGHIELGTYSDQETAILINDAFEINEGRYSRLLLLRPADLESLHLLTLTTSTTCMTLSELLAERKKILLLEDSYHDANCVNRKRSSPVVKAELAVSRKRQTAAAAQQQGIIAAEDSSSEEGSNPSVVSSTSALSSSSAVPLPSLMLCKGEAAAKTALLLMDDEDDEDEDCCLMDTTIKPSAADILCTQEVTVVFKTEQTAVSSEAQDQEQDAMQTLADLASFSQPQLPQQAPQAGGGRPRSFTFSTAQEYSYGDAMQTLTWLASLDEKEVDVARSLFHLANNSIDPDDDHLDNKRTEDEDDHVLFQLPPPPSNSLIKGPATPRKTSFNSQTSQDNFLVEEAADRLSMLSRSAGLLASPMTRAALASPVFTSQQQHHANNNSMTTRHGPYHAAAAASTSSAHSRRPRSQSMSAVDDHHVVKVARSIAAAASATANGSHHAYSIATPSGYTNPGYELRHTDPSSLPIMRVLHASPHLTTMPRGDGYIGIYSPHERVVRVQRFLEKRKHRIWAKKVKYDVRKNFADSRVRIKGRFVKKEEEKAAMTFIQAVGSSGTASSSSNPSSGSKQQQQCLKVSAASKAAAAATPAARQHALTLRPSSVVQHEDEEDDEDDDS